MKNVEVYIEKLNINVKRIERLPSSFSSTVKKMILQDNSIVILKIPYSNEKLEREYYFLNKLANDLPVPKVLNYWAGDSENIGAILLNEIQGQPINDNFDMNLTYKMGELLAKLHSIDFDSINYGINKSNSVTEEREWKQYIYSRIEDNKKNCFEVMDREIYNKCINIFNRFYIDFRMGFAPCIIHLDYRPGNIMEYKGNITGLIDFESARSGAFEIDFVKMKNYVWDKDKNYKVGFINGYKSVKQIYELDDMIDFYNFYNAFGSISWFVDRGKKHLSFFEENMNIINNLIKYL